MKTTHDDFHDHFWDRGNEYTAESNGHVHLIDIKRMIALPVLPGSHTHKLLK